MTEGRAVDVMTLVMLGEKEVQTMDNDSEDGLLNRPLQQVMLFAVAMVVVIVGMVVLVNARMKAIEDTCILLAKTWTNREDALSHETRLIDVQLDSRGGQVIGTLRSSQLHSPLAVHADVGWWTTTLVISALKGHSIVQVAVAEVRMIGEGHLEWKLTGRAFPDYLPGLAVMHVPPAVH